MRSLAAMTWEEVRDLDESGRNVAILPVGALEAHGPHLPLETDVIIASAMARNAAERLIRRDWRPYLLPPLIYTPASFASSFCGSVNTDTSATAVTLAGIISMVEGNNFAALGIANAHLDPANISALEAATEDEDGIY